MSRRWMHDEPGGFVDHDDVIVFELDFQRDGIRQDVIFCWRRHVDRDNFTRRHAELGFPLLVVHQHVARLD
jgi:hypothetical protein